jgi:hypothetical protein
MKTEFDECSAAKPLQDRLWFSRGTAAFWTFLQVCDPRIRLHPPATDEQVGALTDFAGGKLPATLEDFLRRSNGLTFDFDEIVFPSADIIQETLRMRHPDIAFPNDHLLFIGRLGDGDMFAFGKSKKGEWLSDVFWWEHETDSCYACGSGIWGYVANHVGWRHAVCGQAPEHLNVLNEAAYRERLRKISGEAEVLPGLRRLVTDILDLRAKENLGELTSTDLLREFLCQVTAKDFRKIPIEKLLKD